MKKTVYFRLAFLILLLQPVFIFSNLMTASAVEVTNLLELRLPGQFYLVDQDQNMVPDHLAYTLQVVGEMAGSRLWLSGELQALIDNNWRTIAYSSCSYFWNNEPLEATIYFYGGELKRLNANGPFRLVLQARGVGAQTQEVAGLSPPYQGNQFEASDLVWCEGNLRKTSEVVERVLAWANGKGLILGCLEDETFAFDRWRFDFRGDGAEPARRVWVDPQMGINWANIKR